MMHTHTRLLQVLGMKAVKWLTIVMLLIGSIILLPKIGNWITLYRFSQPFFSYPLPPQTTVIAQHSQYGVLSGNGNHCDYSASMTLQTALTDQEILDYYANVSFPTVGDHSGWAAIAGLYGAVPVMVRFDSQEVYISIFDGTYTDSFRMMDLRCH
jgi:hypothetical protein